MYPASLFRSVNNLGLLVTHGLFVFCFPRLAFTPLHVKETRVCDTLVTAIEWWVKLNQKRAIIFVEEKNNEYFSAIEHFLYTYYVMYNEIHVRKYYRRRFLLKHGCVDFSSSTFPVDNFHTVIIYKVPTVLRRAMRKKVFRCALLTYSLVVFSKCTNGVHE